MIAPAPVGTSALLTFGTDRALRNAWFTPESYAHPAKLHLGLAHWIIKTYTREGDTLGDPMAGIGSLLLAAAMGRNVVLREIEPQWLVEAHRNAAKVVERVGLLAGAMDLGAGDARQPWGWTADHLIFSPPYGCGASPSRTSRTALLRKRIARLDPAKYGKRWQQFADGQTAGAKGAFDFAYGDHPDQIGHWRGTRYWTAMRAIYMQAHVALGSGYMVLIVKDHVFKHKHIRTADQTVALCQELGFVLHARHARQLEHLSLWQRRRKEAGATVIEHEDVLVFTKKRGA